ncbi:MAG: DNA polymerase IV [Cytophagales bacterium]|nr:DNA polymerase IV [Cytophagales bacterium]
MDMRSILHLDLDTFFVSVERLKNSALVGKPIIIGGASNRGVVASCSYETRKFGVRSAMPMKQARRLCPEALIISGDMEGYSTYSKMVTDVIAERAPVMEKASIDEFYLDLTGMDRFFGCEVWARELKSRIRKETGLPISYSLSINKLVSKIGTGEAKPDGGKYIPRGEEKGFLAPLSIAKIPMVGDKTFLQLSSMGIKTIQTLRQVPIKLLEREFGKNGKLLWERSNAIDYTPVVPYNEQKSVGTECTFLEDTTDVKFLRECFVAMTEKLGFELRSMGRLTGCVTVKLRYSDFNTYTQQRTIPLTSNDATLIAIAKELFEKLYNKRLLVRLVGVRFSQLVQGTQQLHLFEDIPEMVNLGLAMDKLRLKYGPEAVRRSVVMHGMRY